MKRITRNISCLFGTLLLASAVFTGCKETIDESNFSIATEQTITQYVESTDSLSGIKALFDRVRLGRSEQASSLTSVLSARGNYTAFLPTNRALTIYCDSVLLDETTKNANKDKAWEDQVHANWADLSDAQAELVAKSCIIDNGDENAYETADFIGNGGAFDVTNLNDRLLTNLEVTTDGKPFIVNGVYSYTKYVINGSSSIIVENIEKSNGFVHIVDRVIAPSSDMIADLIGRAENMRIMSGLISLTGFGSQLTEHEDETYEDPQRPLYRKFPGAEGNCNYPRKRYLGYTGFVETDAVFNSDWGIPMPEVDGNGNVTNWNEIQSAIVSRCEAVYGTDAQGDFTNPANAVNRFVSYHFLKGKMAFNRFVRHYNEFDYDPGSDLNRPQQTVYTVNVWDYYATLGMPRGLIKITQLADGDHDIYLNRKSYYNDGRDGDYREIGSDPCVPGVTGQNIRVSAMNEDPVTGMAYENDALNGYYYPIDHILLYDMATRKMLGGERMRVDILTMFHEIASNSIRGGDNTTLTNEYLEDIVQATSGTEIYAIREGYRTTGWGDALGDQMIFSGQFDFTMKLPPVPTDDTYEIRMGIAVNSLRGMAQIYFGDSPTNPLPIGLPHDLRQHANGNPNIPWVADTEDDEANAAVDKDLRLHGYMKGPKYYYSITMGGKPNLRDRGGSLPYLRHILTVQDMKADKTYYMRFKSSLKSTTTQFYLDFLEFVPKGVYNGTKEEDIW